MPHEFGMEVFECGDSHTYTRLFEYTWMLDELLLLTSMQHAQIIMLASCEWHITRWFFLVMHRNFWGCLSTQRATRTDAFSCRSKKHPREQLPLASLWAIPLAMLVVSSCDIVGGKETSTVNPLVPQYGPLIWNPYKLILTPL